MIDKKFWELVAENWRKKEDDIVTPAVDTSGISDIDPEEVPFDEISDDEIDDILADLGLDD